VAYLNLVLQQRCVIVGGGMGRAVKCKKNS
jgi:hypothetical protein